MELQISYLNEILIFVIFAVSLNLLLGNTGQVSVAHAAFGAVGGYALAYMFLHHGTPLWLGTIIGVIAAALVGFIVGLPALRLTTEGLILLTLATQTIIITLATTSSSFGGTYGLQNVTGFTLFGKKLQQPSDFLPLFIAYAAIVVLIVYRMAESPYGRVLRAIREDDVACRSLGKNIYSYKLTVFGVTAAMAGLAGTMLVEQNQLASPSLFGFDQSTAIVAMVILGGTGNILGAILGATVLTLLTPFFENVLNFSADRASLWRLIAYGIVLVVVMRVRPQGLLPEGVSLWSIPRRMFSRGKRKTSAGLPPPEEVSRGGLARTGDLGIEADAHALTELKRHGALPTSGEVEGNTGDVVLSVVNLNKRFGG